MREMAQLTFQPFNRSKYLFGKKWTSHSLCKNRNEEFLKQQKLLFEQSFLRHWFGQSCDILLFLLREKKLFASWSFWPKVYQFVGGNFVDVGRSSLTMKRNSLGNKISRLTGTNSSNETTFCAGIRTYF